MRILLSTCHCLLMAVAGSAGPAAPETILTPKQISKSESPAVVLLEAVGKDQVLQASGFVVGASGLIVTNLHALDSATKVKVSLPDGRRFEEVSILAFDVEQDLAIVSVDLPSGGSGLPTAHLGETSSIGPGDAIVVISNPLGLTLTVTEGIVSAWREPQEIGAERSLEDKGPILPLPTHRLLQISAAISPGSSGGPVFNTKAEVIGIAMAGMLYGMADLNFAAPIDDVPGLLRRDSPMDLSTFHERVDRARADLARPFFETAQLAFEQGNVKNAQRDLERALLLFPAYEGALLLAGRIRMDDGELDQAERLFLKAVEANEDSAEAWYRLATLYDVMAADNGSLSMLGRAQSAYEKCLERDGRHAGAAYGLALLHVRRGNLASAEELLRRATESDSGMADAHAILGMILLERGQLEEAETALKQAIWENADHALAHFGLAQVLMAREDSYRKAAPYWKRFLELSAGKPSLRRERE
ncbi:MAG TPA: trypsin-like peptidase domain-containing protein, partial [Candidatus Polarisedimenticolia bacterium]|nr:trypsin-like peptidase domain-containing protein [Candidatus Polarisedimenticolia bacterium]